MFYAPPACIVEHGLKKRHTKIKTEECNHGKEEKHIASNVCKAAGKSRSRIVPYRAPYHNGNGAKNTERRYKS